MAASSPSSLSAVNSPSSFTKVLVSTGGFALGFAAALASSTETVINFARDMERAGATIENLVGSGTLAGYSAAALTGIVVAAFRQVPLEESSSCSFYDLHILINGRHYIIVLGMSSSLDAMLILVSKNWNYNLARQKEQTCKSVYMLHESRVKMNELDP
ncbi:hypothetical protein Tco_0319233 [Tanacetum coccineum]